MVVRDACNMSLRSALAFSLLPSNTPNAERDDSRLALIDTVWSMKPPIASAALRAALTALVNKPIMACPFTTPDAITLLKLENEPPRLPISCAVLRDASDTARNASLAWSSPIILTPISAMF